MNKIDDQDILELRVQKSAWNVAGLAISVFVGLLLLVNLFA